MNMGIRPQTRRIEAYIGDFVYGDGARRWGNRFPPLVFGTCSSHCIKCGPPGSKSLSMAAANFPSLKAINLQDQKNGGLTEQQAKWIEKMLSNHYAVGLPAV